MSIIHFIPYLVFANIVFGLFVLGENVRSIRNISFAVLCFGIGLWSSGFYMMQKTQTFYWPDKTLLFGGMVMVSGLLVFTSVFPNKMFLRNGQQVLKKYVYVFIPMLLVLALLPFNLYIKSEMFLDHDFKPINGPFFPLYALVCGGFIILSIYNMYWQFKNSLGQKRQKINYVLLGADLFILAALVFDLILPVTGHDQLKLLGPIASLLFIGFAAYSLVTYNLLDIRLMFSKLVANLVAGAGAVAWMVIEYDLFDKFSTGYLVLEFLLAIAVFNLIRKSVTYVYERFWLKEYLDFPRAINALNMSLLNETDALKIIWAANINLKAALSLEWIYYFDANRQKPVFGPQGLPENYRELRGKMKDTELNEYAARLREPYFLSGSEFSIFPDLREAPIAVLPIIESNILQGYFLLGPQKSFYGLNSDQVRKLKNVWAHIQTAYAKAVLYQNLENRVRSQVADLTYKNQKLQQLFEERLDFVQMASHQLRSPITALSGSLQILRKSEALDPDLLRIADEQARKLKDIATGVLNLAKLQKAQKESIKNIVDLNKVFESILPVIQASFAEKNLQIDYTPVQDLQVIGDNMYLEQAFFNLLENAAEHAQHIKIYFHVDERYLVTCIEDNGRGIAPDLVPFIFKKHMRSSSSKGAGLGLYIVKAIINAHPRGHVWFQTNRTGTIFFVRLLRPTLKNAPKIASI